MQNAGIVCIIMFYFMRLLTELNELSHIMLLHDARNGNTCFTCNLLLLLLHIWKFPCFSQACPSDLAVRQCFSSWSFTWPVFPTGHPVGQKALWELVWVEARISVRNYLHRGIRLRSFFFASFVRKDTHTCDFHLSPVFFPPWWQEAIFIEAE